MTYELGLKHTSQSCRQWKGQANTNDGPSLVPLCSCNDRDPGFLTGLICVIIIIIIIKPKLFFKSCVCVFKMNQNPINFIWSRVEPPYHMIISSFSLWYLLLHAPFLISSRAHFPVSLFCSFIIIHVLVWKERSSLLCSCVDVGGYETRRSPSITTGSIVADSYGTIVALALVGVM